MAFLRSPSTLIFFKALLRLNNSLAKAWANLSVGTPKDVYQSMIRYSGYKDRQYLVSN